jgi:hypothetical protein
MAKVPYSLLSVESRPQEHPELGPEEPAEQARLTPDRRPGQGGRRPAQPFITGGAYGLLFLFGAAQAVIGCFQYSWETGQVPLAALGFCATILATCLLGGVAMGSAAGSLLPAVGWFLSTMVLTLPTAQGSVIVTNTAAGEWYLYGGTACAAAGVVITLVRKLGAPAARRRPARRGAAGNRAPAQGRSAPGAGL